MDRAAVVSDLIHLRRPLAAINEDLREFSWDSVVELVTLTRDALRSILGRYLSGELSESDVTEWAEAIEGRDDIGFDSELAKNIVFELANPYLSAPLTPTVAEHDLGRLGGHPGHT